MSTKFMSQYNPNNKIIVKTTQSYDRKIIAFLINQRMELGKRHKATIINLYNILTKIQTKGIV